MYNDVINVNSNNNISENTGNIGENGDDMS
jgi:hypothetical protein